MERICFLLSETTLPIGKIAEMSGYENANHLRLLFKEEFKMTMTEYRNQFCTVSEQN
jgi:AraC-like DNA-binding protein